MGWWNGLSLYYVEEDNLRLIWDIIRLSCSAAAGRQIYAIPAQHARDVRAPYTFDHNKRFKIIAILIAMLDPDSPGLAKMYPDAMHLAQDILERKEVSTNLSIIAARDAMVDILHINCLSWYKKNRGRANAQFPAGVKTKMALFAETMIRAAQIYRETIERNRVLWDINEPSAAKEAEMAEFNLSFDWSYVETAARDLEGTRKRREAHHKDRAEDTILPPAYRE